MLWITIGINQDIIDRISIHNTGNNKDGLYEYEVVNPYTGDRIIEETLWHERTKGYRPLLKKALTLLGKHKIPETSKLEFHFGKEEKENKS